MNFNEPNRATGGRLVAGFLLALVLGALAPAVTILEMSLLLPVIMFGGVFMVFLYGYAGRMPAWLYMVTLLSSTAYLMGGRFMWMMLVGGAMPAIIVMQGIYMKQPFFDQMRRGILYYGLGLVVALYIAYTAYGANMIGRLTDTVQSQFKSMPDEFFLPFVETVNSALSAGGVDASRLITVEYYRAQVAALVPLMGDTYAQTLPGLLLAGVDDPNIFGTHDLGAALAARRGGEPAVLLAHAPSIHGEAAARGVSLVLCGHVHGGQICLRNGRTLAWKHWRFPRRVWKGRWTEGQTQGYATTGVGACGAPLRLNCPPEIVLVRLSSPRR